MDKWFQNPWAIKGVSLLIAIMLFLIVNLESGTQPTGLPITNNSKVLGDVDLHVYYDEESHVITVAPETVEVTLRGPQNVLTLLSLRSDYEVYIDVRDREPGEYYVDVQHRNFPNGLTVNVRPSTVRVNIQERQTVSFPVHIELLNEGDIEPGYTIGNPTANPSNVEITAGTGVIDQIAAVRAYVDVVGRDATFEEAARVVVLDQNGNELNINTTPPAVDVTVPITSPNKEVPLRIGREGTLPEGFAIESITAEPSSVTIYGPIDVINDISFIELMDVDLSDVTEDTELEVTVPVPNNVERVSPENVTIRIDISEEDTRVFSDFIIDVIGLEDGLDYQFISPEDGTLNLNLMGSSNVIGRLERSDLHLYIDISDLSEGEHDVPIQFNSPQNVRMDAGRSHVQLVIFSNDEEVDNDIVENEESNEIEQEQLNEQNEDTS
ncbi:CdaR family protein [Evansella sp. AB-P1]|uniref:CdaR family protein n=1 Tax=Evansella sp. AB-P1 TaxID=3037653 RepID=UPI00241C8E5C|nr:CdaR family protein [Evansella sp. AB-P1]MDG5788067.1 CdaR family protein [Evansella sp. AB-P1]